MKRIRRLSFARSVSLATSITLLLAALVATPAVRARPISEVAGAAGLTVINADITADTTLRLANSPYLITNPIKVSAAATLTLEPGVQVQFLQDTGLQIDGGLVANGSHTQPISFIANGIGIRWQGLRIIQPASNIWLQGVTIKNAQNGVAIEPPAQGGAANGVRVDILESLLDSNVVGISAKYGAGNAPHLTLRNSLLTNNSIGVLIDGLPNGSGLASISYNSFVLNGIGIKGLNLSGAGLHAEHQWWGAASGPTIGDTTYCDAPLPPSPATTPPDVICGTIDAAPWSVVPAGRAVLPADKDIAITSAIGTAALGDNTLAATSVVTLTIPANTFEQAPDVVLAPRSYTDPLPGLPAGLDFEISAIVNGQKLSQLASGKQVALQIDYTLADLEGVPAQSLKLYGLDESQGFWSYVGLQTVPDPPNGRVQAQIERLGPMRVTALDFTHIWLPLLNG